MAKQEFKYSKTANFVISGSIFVSENYSMKRETDKINEIVKQS